MRAYKEPAVVDDEIGEVHELEVCGRKLDEGKHTTKETITQPNREGEIRMKIGKQEEKRND